MAVTVLSHRIHSLRTVFGDDRRILTRLVEAMGSGRADIGLIPAFPAMLGRERYGLEPILVSVRQGTTRYRVPAADTTAQVIDFVAGMSDRNALRLHDELFRPHGMV